MAAVTNYHKCGVLQHTFILLQLWRPEVRNQFHWAKVKVLEGLVPSDGSWGQYLSLPFLTSGVHQYSLTHNPFFTFLRPLSTAIPRCVLSWAPVKLFSILNCRGFVVVVCLLVLCCLFGTHLWEYKNFTDNFKNWTCPMKRMFKSNRWRVLYNFLNAISQTFVRLLDTVRISL